MNAICNKCGAKMDYDPSSNICPKCVRRSKQRVADARDILKAMSPAERAELFWEFCVHCGSSDRGCQCGNDE